MFLNQSSLSKKLVVAAALALVASGVAIADDSSIGRFSGDAYSYLNQPMHGNFAADWRLNHPTGPSDRELQAASSSSLAAAAFQSDYPSPVFASSATDPSWRPNHPNGLTESELEAASSSALAVWQLPGRAGVGSAPTNVAQVSRRSISQSRN
jgi:hypothetical protein